VLLKRAQSFARARFIADLFVVLPLRFDSQFCDRMQMSRASFS
jgi:hypothetical protein